MKHRFHSALTASAISTAMLLASCGGGGDDLPPDMKCGDQDDEELGPNNELSGAPELDSGKIIGGCVDVSGDIDNYVFTTSDKPAGGYLSFEVTNKGTSKIGLQLFVVEGAESIAAYVSDPGENIVGHLATIPRTVYGVQVRNGMLGAFEQPYQYHLKVEWKEVKDAHEPNDFQGMPKTIGVGKDIKARMFAGHDKGTDPTPVKYDDWYAIKLKEGSVQVAVLDVPETLAVRAELHDEDGTEYLCATGCLGRQGMPLRVGNAEIPAGDYTLRVTRHSQPEVDGSALGEEPPAHFTQDYTLTVTQ